MPSDEETRHSSVSTRKSEYLRKDFLCYAASYARNFHDAEDAVSHVMEKIVRCYAKNGRVCPAEYNDPVAWSKTVIRNYIIDLHRRETTRRTYLPKQYSPPVDFAEDILDELLAGELRQLINALKPLDHDIAVMRFIEGLEPVEIARILKRKAVTVRASLFRTRSKIRRQLGITAEPQRISPRETV